MSIKVLSFDVDGTLTRRGEPLKQEAWDVLGHGWPIDVWEALRKAREKYSGGQGSRYDIIRSMLQEVGVAGEKLEAKIEEWAEAYQVAVMSLIRDDFRPEVRDVLRSFNEGGYKLYVNSATEEDGLRACLRGVGLADFFKDILGYPKDGSRKKADNLRFILQAEGVGPDKLIHIGDSKSDFDAVKSVGCRFIGIANADNKWETNCMSEGKFLVVSNLTEIEEAIKSNS